MSQIFNYPIPFNVPTYATFASLPASANDGSLAITIDTHDLYIFETGTGWVILSTPGVAPVTTVTASSPLFSSGGTAPNITIQLADATHNGYLSSVDWGTFNSKQAALTIGNISDVGTDGLVITGGTGAIIGSGVTLAQHVADASHNGYLSSVDWSTFNSKQSALTIGNLTDVGTDGITIIGGTGSVIGTGTSISQHVADTTHNGYLSSTDWNSFNSVATAAVGKTLYVDVSRTDTYTATGSELFPYKDPQDAITQIIANGDNDSTHPYTLLVKAGNYGTLTMSNAALVFVNVVGLGGSTTSAINFTQIDFTGANLFRGGIKGLSVATLNMTASAANNILYIVDCKLGTTTLSSATEIDISGTQTGAMTITNCTQVLYQAGYLGVTGALSLVNSTMIAQACSFLSTVSIDATSAFLPRNGCRFATGAITVNGVMQAYGCWIGVSVVINTGGSLLNRGSFLDPANISGTLGLAGYTQQSSSQMIGYTPTTSANWNTVPTQSRGALDTLATSGIVKSQTQNIVLASPNGSSGLPSFRALVAADLPAVSPSGISLTDSHILVGNGSNVAADVAVSGDLTLVNTGAFTVSSVGGSTASAVNSATVLANAATSANTNSAIVRRDGSGNFDGSIITAHTELVLEDPSAGTGLVGVRAATGSATYTLILPGTGGTSNYVLSTDGSGTTSWVPQNSGSVTSVAMTVPSFLSVAGSPITSSGTLAVTLSGTALPVANGGTGQTSLTAHDVLIGNGSSGITQISPSTAGFVLTSNGTGADPSFVTPVTSGVRTINAQTGTTYTFALTDGSGNGNNPLVTASNGSAQTYTVPTNASVAFPTGTQIDLMQQGAGKVTIAAAGGVTINSKGGNLSISAQYVAVSLVKTASDTWTLIGDLIA